MPSKKKPKTPKRADRKSRELRRIALGIHEGTITPSWVVPEDIFATVFMPLALCRAEAAQEMIDQGIVAFYGEMTNTFGRSINGFPIFHSCGGLTKSETTKIVQYLKEVQSWEKGTTPSSGEGSKSRPP